MDTIFALATARGKAGVSVVRVSGPAAHAAAERFVGRLPRPHMAGLRAFRDDAGELVDHCLVLTFEEGKSFTGEQVVEFQTHGSPAVVSAVLDCLASVPGCRIAEAGEFTRRALENDRLDLAEVEGLGDLIEAETEAQRRQAMRVFTGALSEAAEAWRSDLLRALALIEVTIDFADEEVPVDVTPEVLGLLRKVAEGLDAQVAGYSAAERIRDGFEVALVGETNVGKSTLLNRLAGRDAAITSEIAGTTRDVIEVRMDLDGLPVTFLDTAGVRADAEGVEAIGIGRTVERAERADLRVFLLPSAEAVPVMEPAGDDIVVVGKADVTGGGEISGKTGEGVTALLQRISGVLSSRASGAGLAIKLRHKAAMEDAAFWIGKALRVLETGGEVEIAAEDLRRAVRALDGLVGRVGVEDILGEIFARFCIGK